MSNKLFCPLLAVMFWLPLPEGSKPEWAMGILMMLVYGLALFWLLGYALNRLPVTLAFQKARWFHLGFILVTCWLFIQQMPLPADWVKVLSPYAWDIHSQAYLALGLPLPDLLPLSLDPFATQVTALLALAYYLLFWSCPEITSTFLQTLPATRRPLPESWNHLCFCGQRVAGSGRRHFPSLNEMMKLFRDNSFVCVCC